MKKIFLFFAILFSVASVMVSADDGPGPISCLNPDGGIRETCKYVSTVTTVSLDATLQNDYLLGEHSRVEIGRFNDNPYIPSEQPKYSKYSELVSLTNKQTIDITGDDRDKAIITEPEDFGFLAVLGKEYFLSRLADAFKEGGLSFDKDSIPKYINIYVLNKGEILANNKDIDSYLKPRFSVPYDLGIFKIDSAFGISRPYANYSVISLDDQGYGKHIYAPRGKIAEMQYLDFDKGSILNDSNLQITIVGSKHGGVPTVPITSPLKSIKNYWKVIKKNGKLALVWQKSEYGLDNGQIKTFTNIDKNVSAALLFSDSTGDVSATASSSLATSTSVVVPTEKKVGFIAKFFNFILSWFK